MDCEENTENSKKKNIASKRGKKRFYRKGDEK